MENTNTNTTQNGSEQISAEQLDRINPKLLGKFWGLPDYMRLTIIHSVCSYPIYSAKGRVDTEREMVEHYFESIGIIGYASDILDMANGLAVPEIVPENDPARPVFDLELSTRTQNALTANGIYSLGDLAKTDRLTLYKIPFIGKLALREINDVLIANGYEAKK